MFHTGLLVWELEVVVGWGGGGGGRQLVLQKKHETKQWDSGGRFFCQEFFLINWCCDFQILWGVVEGDGGGWGGGGGGWEGGGGTCTLWVRYPRCSS